MTFTLELLLKINIFVRGVIICNLEVKSVNRSVVSNSLLVHGLAFHAPLSMRFSRQEYWGGLPFPSLGDLPDPGIEPESPAMKADSLPFEPPNIPAQNHVIVL